MGGEAAEPEAKAARTTPEFISSAKVTAGTGKPIRCGNLKEYIHRECVHPA